MSLLKLQLHKLTGQELQPPPMQVVKAKKTVLVQCLYLYFMSAIFLTAETHVREKTGIKMFLRSVMGQQRPSSIAIINIERVYSKTPRKRT